MGINNFQTIRFNILDVFRGFAAVFVCIFHMAYVGSVTEWPFFKNSYLFVNFFFILSGFVLTHTYGFKVRLKSFKSFFISRTFRIFPLHLVMLLLFIILEIGKVLIYSYDINLNNEPFSGLKSLSELIPNLFLMQAWIKDANSFSWNYPSWSISVEYYIYMVFYLTLLLRREWSVTIWFLIILLNQDFINEPYYKEVREGLYYFFMGALLYSIYKMIYDKVNLSKYVYTLLELLALCLIIYGVSVLTESNYLLLTLLFSFTILIFSFERGYVSRKLKIVPFLFIGKISYSIYMIHVFIISCSLSLYLIIEKIFNIKLTIMVEDVRFMDLDSLVLNNLAVIITIILIILMSNLSNKYIEQKFQYKTKK